jgi:hypothetical protein
MLIQLNLSNLLYSHHKRCENAERPLTCISSGMISASKQEEIRDKGDFLLDLIVPQVWGTRAGGLPLGQHRPLSGLVLLSHAPAVVLRQSSGPQSYGRPPGFFPSGPSRHSG